MGIDTETSEIDKYSKMWRTAEEVLEAEEVRLEGTIPHWLTGSYYRVGPGKFDFDDNFSVAHWLDGYALIAQFEIDAQKRSVCFRSKYLRSDSYVRAIKGQRPAVSEFATPAFCTEAKKGFFSRLIPQIVPETTDNTNHAFFTFGKGSTCDKHLLFSINGAGVMNGVDPETLDRLDPIDPSTLGINMCTAHPLTDAVTGYTYNVGFSLVLTGLKYNIIRIPPIDPSQEVKGQLHKSKIICSIPTQWTTSLSFLHSFGMTQNYIIFIEQPLVVNLSKMLNSSVRGKQEAFKDWLEWRTDSSNRFYVIEKSSGRVVTKIPIVSSELFFFFHVINCYEDSIQNEIVLDLSTYENADILLGATNLLSHVRQPSHFQRHGDDDEDQELRERSPKSKRFVIPLSPLGIDIRRDSLEENLECRSKVIKLDPQLLLPDGGLELASINRKFAGRDYRYFYASGLLSQGVFRNALVKVDVVTGKVTEFRASDQYIFGEPIFVSSEASSEEDDGVLIVPMTHVRKSEPDAIFFFDARTMTQMATAGFKNWIPPAIHGIYVPKH